MYTHFNSKPLTLCIHNPKRSILLLCSVDGDVKCLSGSCDPKKKFPVMIVAIVASAVVIVLLALALFFCVQKEKGIKSCGR